MKKIILSLLLLALNTAHAVFIQWPDLNPHPDGPLAYRAYVGVEQGTGNFIHVKDVGTATRVEMPDPPAGQAYYYFIAAYYVEFPDIETVYDSRNELGFRPPALVPPYESFSIHIPPGAHGLQTLWRIDADKFWMPVGTAFGPRELVIPINIKERQRFYEAVDLNVAPPQTMRPGVLVPCGDDKEDKKHAKMQEKLSKRWKHHEPYLVPAP